MSKIHPINAKWDAVAALTCALEETEPDEQVFVIVRKKDMTRCKYAANITNMEARTGDDQQARIDMTVEIKDVKHLEKVIKSIKGVQGVIGVERTARA